MIKIPTVSKKPQMERPKEELKLNINFLKEKFQISSNDDIQKMKNLVDEAVS